MKERIGLFVAIVVAAAWGVGSIVLAYSYVVNPGGGG
jgi:hypothetical protein